MFGAGQTPPRARPRARLYSLAALGEARDKLPRLHLIQVPREFALLQGSLVLLGLTIALYLAAICGVVGPLPQMLQQGLPHLVIRPGGQGDCDRFGENASSSPFAFFRPRIVPLSESSKLLPAESFFVRARFMVPMTY
jgi:hypothetical protein